MTVSDFLNPEDYFITMKRDGTFDGNNDVGYSVPDYNPNAFPPIYNPDGKVPVLNPSHYINPLVMKYTNGPLGFDGLKFSLQDLT